ncbi:MAG: hypothetical protein ACI802_002787, partial [Candidatus Paceibacteria bacterium]
CVKSHAGRRTPKLRSQSKNGSMVVHGLGGLSFSDLKCTNAAMNAKK